MHAQHGLHPKICGFNSICLGRNCCKLLASDLMSRSSRIFPHQLGYSVPIDLQKHLSFANLMIYSASVAQLRALGVCSTLNVLIVLFEFGNSKRLL